MTISRKPLLEKCSESVSVGGTVDTTDLVLLLEPPH
jgi:hypothetical protein